MSLTLRPKARFSACSAFTRSVIRRARSTARSSHIRVRTARSRRLPGKYRFQPTTHRRLARNFHMEAAKMAVGAPPLADAISRSPVRQPLSAVREYGALDIQAAIDKGLTVISSQGSSLPTPLSLDDKENLIDVWRQETDRAREKNPPTGLVQKKSQETAAKVLQEQGLATNEYDPIFWLIFKWFADSDASVSSSMTSAPRVRFVHGNKEFDQNTVPREEAYKRIAMTIWHQNRVLERGVPWSAVVDENRVTSSHSMLIPNLGMSYQTYWRETVGAMYLKLYDPDRPSEGFGDSYGPHYVIADIPEPMLYYLGNAGRRSPVCIIPGPIPPSTIVAAGDKQTLLQFLAAENPIIPHPPPPRFPR